MRSSFIGSGHLAAIVFSVLAWPVQGQGLCVGDCDASGSVEVVELIRGVSIALGQISLEDCDAADVDGDGTVGVGELVAAVAASLIGCTSTSSPTATMTPTATSSPTSTVAAAPFPTAKTTGLVEKCGGCNLVRGRQCSSKCVETHCRADTSLECTRACLRSCAECEEGLQCVELLRQGFTGCIEIDPSAPRPQCGATPTPRPLPTPNDQRAAKCEICDVQAEVFCFTDCLRDHCGGADSEPGEPCRQACRASCQPCGEGLVCVEVLGTTPRRAFVACIDPGPSAERPQCLDEFPGFE